MQPGNETPVQQLTSAVFLIIDNDERVRDTALRTINAARSGGTDTPEIGAASLLEAWITTAAGIDIEQCPDDETGRLLLWSLARSAAAHVDYHVLVHALMRNLGSREE